MDSYNLINKHTYNIYEYTITRFYSNLSKLHIYVILIMNKMNFQYNDYILRKGKWIYIYNK